MQSQNFLIQGAQTTPVMYVGPKAVKRDTVSGYQPQIRFPRGEAVEVPLMVAQALLPFDCFVRADKDTAEFFAEQSKREEELAAQEAEALLLAQQKELDNQKTVIDLDGELVDIFKLTFAEIETFCLANELDVSRLIDAGGKQEDKIDLAVRVRKAFDEANAEPQA